MPRIDRYCKGCPEVAQKESHRPLQQVRGQKLARMGYSHSVVKSYLQSVLVCRSSSQFVLFSLSLKEWRNSMGSNLGRGFRVIRGNFAGHGGSRWTGGALCVISRTDKVRYLLEPEVREAAVPVGDRLLVHPAPFLDGHVGGKAALYAPGSRSVCRANVPLSLL